MNIITIMCIISFFIPIILMLLSFISLGELNLEDREKSSPFECGFDPMKKARLPFSIQFFMITILFLVFDVEVTLLFPLGLLTSNMTALPLMMALIITILLLLGLIHEWNQGMLNWSN